MPPVLTLVTADRPATLIERLALDLGRAPLSPFDEEVVVVQSQGMARWIRHELARRHGCAASLRIPFPAAFCHRLAADLDARELDPRFDREAMTWRILQMLEDGLATEGAFEPLRAFVQSDDADTRKRLGLAARIAGRFDDYQLYRPDVLLAWERREAVPDSSEHARWQSELWRRLCEGAEPPRHLARWFTESIQRLERGDVNVSVLPPRVSVFGVSTLPPLFVRLLRALARHVPVRAYVLAPPSSTWSAPNNPLFAAFGGATRELLALLTESRDEGTAITVEHAESREPRAGSEELDAPASPSMLRQLQDDVRAGTARGPEAGHAPRVPVAPDDESLLVHLCHSPMREMEVLRDQLLAAFASDPTLRPHDVLVMVPDIATYAPFVEAVFGVGEPELPRIPHHVADRPVVQESPIADAALHLLRLVGGRWTAAEIVALLDVPAIRRRACIAAGATDRILGWIDETNIRWGRDGAMRKERFELPAVEANSWRAGIDRLLMGYATGHADGLVADVLPCAGDTIGDPETLGAFAHWVDRLFDALDELRTARTLAEWGAALRGLVAGFLAPDGDAECAEVALLVEAIDRLRHVHDVASVRGPMDLAVVRDWLERALASDSLGAGFLVGGMTVGALKPMRAIPFRVIAILGLDDASFPRRDRRSAFDLLEIEPRAGDRDARADDRQLFLDTLLSAGDRLILSYVGRSARSNAPRAASVCVAELLDVVDRTFEVDAADTARPRARDAVVVEHKLQPFSLAYYTPTRSPRLFSYSRANARAAGAKHDERVATPFVAGPLPTGIERAGKLVVSLRDLAECWVNPSRFFCERVLDMRLLGDDAPLDDCEPMVVDSLMRYGVQDEILRRHLAGDRDAARERMVAAARGHLPSGALATLWFDRLDGDIAAFLAALGRPSFYEPVPVEVEGSDWVIVGRLDGLTDDGRVQARPASRKLKDLVRAWITHLAFVAAHGDVTSRLVATDWVTTMPFVEDAVEQLDALVNGMRAVMREPIPVFENASFAYVDLAVKLAAGTSRSKKTPIEAARACWEGVTGPNARPGDGANAHAEICWRGRDPLADEATFKRWASTLWEPMLTTMKATKLEVPA